MIKKAKDKFSKIISRHFALTLVAAFISLPITFFMLYISIYNVFAMATALFSIVGAVKLRIWKFGNNIFNKETTLSRKHAEFKKSDAYRKVCLDDAAEAFLIACITFVAAILFQIGFMIFK